LLDSGAGEQAYFDPHHRLFYGPWPLLAASPLLTDRPREDHQRAPQRVLIVGLGGGTHARLAVAAFPNVRVRGIEIDRGLVQVARRHLGLSHPRIQVLIGDGRARLRREPARSADVVILDAYGDLYVPFHLATVEFYRLVRRTLRPGGVVVTNLVRMDRRRTLTNAVGRTLRRVFAHVQLVAVPEGQHRLVVASDHPLARRRILQRVSQLQPPALARYARRAFRTLRAWRGGPGPIFTDDRSPVEFRVHLTLLRRFVGKP
jgi:spermidine synthase